MPRTLPWLTGDKASRAVRPPPDSEHDKTPKATKTEHARKSPDKDVFKSSSPPPQEPTLGRCPSEDFLIPGFDNDDIYIMVEDEFYAVAHTFTQHLHYAEYVKRTHEAKTQNAAMIHNIARPTDNQTLLGEDVKKRKEAEALRGRQKVELAGVNNDGAAEGNVVDEDEDEDDVFQDDSWRGTSLYDLMVSPRKLRALVGKRGVKSRTRAAAGYAHQASSQASSAGGLLSSPTRSRGQGHGQEHPLAIDETASEDDDLDVQPRTTFRTADDIKTPIAKIEQETKPKIEKTRPPIIAPRKYLSHGPSQSAKPEVETEAEAEAKPTPSIRAKTTQTQTKHPSVSDRRRKRLLFDDLDGLSEPRPKVPFIKQESKERTNSPSRYNRNPSGSRGGNTSEGESKKKSRLNEVPTFIL